MWSAGIAICAYVGALKGVKVVKVRTCCDKHMLPGRRGQLHAGSPVSLSQPPPVAQPHMQERSTH